MMNLKRMAAGIASLLVLTIAQAQQKITLAEVLQSIETNYPASKQKELLAKESKQNETLLNASLLPQLNVTGQAAYQSEVTKFEMPGLPSDIGQKPFNYNAGIEMQLPLTQFGTVATRKQLEKARASVAINQVDAELQQLRERVTNLFGNILLQKQNINILKLRVSDLALQVKKIAAGVANGAVLKSNQLVLESDILSTQQKMDDITGTIRALLTELNTLTGLNTDSSTQFELTGEVADTGNINRPELKAFAAQRNVLDIQSELLKKESRPDLYVFGQGMFGRPGFNFLNNEARIYGIGGVGLSWNLNNLFNRSTKQKTIDINKQILGKQEETFMLNLKASLASKAEEIEKYQAMITRDAAIVQNRQEVIKAARSQLENGAITSTEYLTELNAENTAELNLVLHQVQLSVAKAQYNTLSGY